MKSMTGYANGIFRISGYGNCNIEIKSLNGKNLNISVRMPPEMSHLEIDMRKIISKHISRGNLFIYIRTDYSPAYLKRSIAELTERMEASGINSGNAQEPVLNRFMDMLMPQPELSETAGKSVLRSVNTETKALVKMRSEEGEEIRRELVTYINAIKKSIAIIRKHNGRSVRKKKKKLAELIKDNDQLIKENILIYADKMDISEELQRLESHMNKIRKADRGSKMNFILQEILRETNTIGSKSEDINITDAVISIKEYIEKMKEQALNVE